MCYLVDKTEGLSGSSHLKRKLISEEAGGGWGRGGVARIYRSFATKGG